MNKLYYIPAIPCSANKMNNIFIRKSSNGKSYPQVNQSHEYSSFIKHFADYLPEFEPISGNVILTYFIVPSSKRKFDLDNTAKNAIDAIVRAGMIDDDSCIVSLHIYKLAPNKQKAGMYFYLQPINEVRTVEKLLEAMPLIQNE